VYPKSIYFSTNNWELFYDFLTTKCFLLGPAAPGYFEIPQLASEYKWMIAPAPEDFIFRFEVQEG